MTVEYLVKPPRLERDVQREIVQHLEARGWLVYRTNNGAVWNKKRGAYIFHGRAGFPDLVAVYPVLKKLCRFDGVLFIECKSSNGKLSEAQEQFKCAVAGLDDVRYVVARSWSDVEAVIDGH